MGRIIFDPKAFAPQYVAPRREPGERSKLDAFLTPSGLVTSATLLKMLGGLRLPAGLRDQGVDASAMAMKEAAKARASAKDSFQKQQQIFENKYTLLSQLGEGTHGQVWKIRRNQDQKNFAVKFEQKEDINEFSLVKKERIILNGI